MRFLIIGLILSTAACTNTVPQVSSLGRGNGSVGTPFVPSPYINTPILPGSIETVTTGGYKVKAIIHSGTESQHKTSIPGGYKLEVRSLSL